MKCDYVVIREQILVNWKKKTKLLWFRNCAEILCHTRKIDRLSAYRISCEQWVWQYIVDCRSREDEIKEDIAWNTIQTNCDNRRKVTERNTKQTPLFSPCLFICGFSSNGIIASLLPSWLLDRCSPRSSPPDLAVGGHKPGGQPRSRVIDWGSEEGRLWMLAVVRCVLRCADVMRRGMMRVMMVMRYAGWWWGLATAAVEPGKQVQASPVYIQSLY